MARSMLEIAFGVSFAESDDPEGAPEKGIEAIASEETRRDIAKTIAEVLEETAERLEAQAKELTAQLEELRSQRERTVMSEQESDLFDRRAELNNKARRLRLALGTDGLPIISEYEFEVLLNGPDEIPERISEELWAMSPELRKSVLRRASDVGDPVKWGWLMDPFEDLCKTRYPEQIRALEGEVDGVKFSLPETPWDLIVAEVKLGIDDRAKESISMMIEEKLQKDAAFIVTAEDGEVVNYVHAAFWGKGHAWAEDFENGEHERYIPEDEAKGAIRAWAEKHGRKLEWR